LSVTSAMVDSQARALRAGALSRIALVTSVELAQCILATDVAAYRDNLDYSARRNSRGAHVSAGAGLPYRFAPAMFSQLFTELDATLTMPGR